LLFFRNRDKEHTNAIELSVHSIINVLFFNDFLKIIKRRRLFEQIVYSNMLDIENVTNFKVQKSNSNESTNNKRIKKICIRLIQLIDEHASICLQNKLHVIKIKMNLFQNFENITTLSFCDIVFFFRVWSNIAFITYRMSLFIAQHHQNLFSIFKIDVYREYDHVVFIINESKSEKIDKSDFKSVHDFLLSEFSDEWNILFQEYINRLSNKNETRNKNSIKYANFDRFTNVDDVLTKKSIQDLDDLCCIWMSFFYVTDKIDYSQFFAAKLKFFFENNAISFFNVCQNIVQSLNMLHNKTSNFKKNKFVIVHDFRFFHFYIVHKRKRAMKYIIDDNFIDYSNELNHKIDCFHENRNHFHQIERHHKNDHVFTFFNQR
jgi:hypothetical protein